MNLIEKVHIIDRVVRFVKREKPIHQFYQEMFYTIRLNILLLLEYTHTGI